MDQQQRVRMLSGVLAMISMVAVGIFTYDRFRGTADVVSDELVGIVITSDNEAGVIAVGDSIELAAEGDYATMTQPIRAEWSILEGVELVELTGCGNRRTCTVTGREPGVATILAEAEGFEAAVDITVEAHEANPFTDDLPAWAADAIIRMYNLGIIRGYDDGSFGAADPVTRGQVITLLTRILTSTGLAEEPQSCSQVYGDVAPDHYAFAAACLFRQHDWSSQDAGFMPDTEASRGQTAAFVARVFGETIVEAMGSEPPMNDQLFDDVPVDSAFYGDVAVVSHTEVMTGYPNGNFGPEDELNRAAVAVIMDRLLSQVDEYGITELVEGEHGSAVRDLSVIHVAVPPSVDQYSFFSVIAAIENSGNTWRATDQNISVEFRFDEDANGTIDHRVTEFLLSAPAVGTNTTVNTRVRGLSGIREMTGDPDNEWPLDPGGDNIIEVCVLLGGDDNTANDCRQVHIEAGGF